MRARRRGRRALAAAAALVVAGCDAPEMGSAPPPPAGAEDPSPSTAAALRPGAGLYDGEGKLWGTVLEVSPAHRFGNGVVEPGVLVDYGPRMGDPPVPPQWLPRRSAERFTVR